MCIRDRDFGAAQLDEHRTHGFSLDDVVAARTQNDLLQPQRQHDDDHQQDGKRRAFADALERAARAGNQLVNAGRQGVDFLAEAEDGGHAEVGQRAGQNQQRARACGRQNQRHGDAPDDVPLLCAGDSGGFLQRRVHALQRGDHLHEHEREVIRTLDVYKRQDIARPSRTVAHLRAAQRVEVVKRAGAVFRHPQHLSLIHI